VDRLKTRQDKTPPIKKAVQMTEPQRGRSSADTALGNFTRFSQLPKYRHYLNPNNQTDHSSVVLNAVVTWEG